MKPELLRSARLLLLLVALIGLTGGIGRACGSQGFGAWLPGAVQMKEATAILFVGSAILAFVAAAHTTGRVGLASCLLGSAMLLWLLVGTCQELIRFERLVAPVKASVYPSLVTLLAFIAAQCAIQLLTLNGPRWVAHGLAISVCFVGVVVLAGYVVELLGCPWGHWLYFYWPGWVTAVAPNTGTAFLLLGFALGLLCRIAVPEPRGLRRAIQDIKLEHFGIFVSFLFATWVLACNSFTYSPGLAQAIQLLTPTGLDPEAAFALPLYLSMALQVFGLRRRAFLARVGGCLLAAAVFFALIVSIAHSNPRGIGIPLLIIPFAGYLLLAVQITAHQDRELRDLPQ